MIDSNDFWLSPGRKEYIKYLKSNPLINPIIQTEMYHGNKIKGLTKLTRPIHFTATPEWCRLTHLSNKVGFGQIYICWMDIKKPYYPNNDETEELLEKPSLLATLLKTKKKEGYDSLIQRAESTNVIIFGNVKIINALTDKQM